MHKKTLLKPDGRTLHLYGDKPVQIQDATAPAPASEPSTSIFPHLRWHPLRGEWVGYAANRQNRTFLPPPEFNPLAPTTDPKFPTELPTGLYDVAVFDNLFPSFSAYAVTAPKTIVKTMPGSGACEVVVFDQDPNQALGKLPLSHIELILNVWAERTLELGTRDDIKYVFIFENRGVEVGVTLHHPHGQIYAYPFIPPIAARELSAEADYFNKHHHRQGLLEAHIAAEIQDNQRMLFEGEEAVAFVPVCARYAYEVWIAPKQRVGRLHELSTLQCRDLARALKTTLLKYDGLWKRPFPYVMALHQAPTDGEVHPESHLHFEFYPPMRMQGRLKYLAGSEIGMGVFTADTLPEQKVRELQSVEVTLE